MNHPTYNLRPNKSVDRFLFVDLLLRLRSVIDYSDFTYVGLGGPFMEDFRLIHSHFPEIKLICIESDSNTQKRQRYNRPCRTIKFHEGDTADFPSTADFNPNKKHIVWLDFMKSLREEFGDFQNYINQVCPGSIIKVTLNCNADQFYSNTDLLQSEKVQNFISSYVDYLPKDVENHLFRRKEFPSLLLEMLKIASQKASISINSSKFFPLTAFKYRDGQPMLTLTGIVLPNQGIKAYNTALKGWKYKCTSWTQPIEIDVPNLTLKERLHLDSILPTETKTADLLRKSIGYKIASTESKTKQQLLQYRDFYRHYPYFSKVSI